jgi:methyl-accepting chemotaxis protein
VVFITYKLKSLDELAGTEEEKRLTQDLHTYFEKFSTGIQADLVQLIKNSGLRSTEIEAEYGNIDNLLDEHGDRVDENLAKLEASLQNKLMDASEDDSDYKEKIDTVNYLRMSLLYIKLAVKNSIIDKDEGQVKAENMEIIDMNIDYLSSNLVEIDEMAETEEEKGFVGAVRDALPKLAEVTNVGLVNLIENSAVEAKQIKAAFVKIDDTLNDYSDKLEDNLKKIQVSVQQQGKEADEASERLLTKLKMVGWITFFVTLVIITTALFLISRSIIKPISRTGHNLSESADQVSSASALVSTASQQLAEGSSEQAASIEETSSSLEEMASMTKQNADNANQADNLMKEANQVVGQANDSMAELTSSMAEICQASEETSKIIKTIDEIAFQTNLLALNAAVEAARAGEAGAGFAVVADEVRNLAMRAADAAKNTADLIEGTVKKVNGGGDLVATTNKAFSEVAASATKVGELVGEIAAASNEQAEGIEQVNKSVAEMDKVTQQNAANAEESASASEEMNAQAEQMKRFVDDLVTLVGGSGKGVKSVSYNVAMAPKAVTSKVLVPPSKKELTVHQAKEVRPEHVIPMADDDFKEF